MKNVLSNVSNDQMQNVSCLNFGSEIKVYKFESKVSLKKANNQLLESLDLFQNNVFEFCKTHQTFKGFNDLLNLALCLKQEANKLVCDFWEANFGNIVYLVNKIDTILLDKNTKYWFCKVKKAIMILIIKKGEKYEKK